VLFIAGIVSALAAIPLAVEVFGPTISAAPQPSLPFPVIIAIGIVQNLILLAVMVLVGLKLGRTLRLGTPLLESWLEKNGQSANWKTSLRAGLLVGIGVGVVLTLMVLALVPTLPKLPFVAIAKIAFWKRILTCFYGGIFEELLMRFFLLTLVAWIATKIARRESGRLTSLPFWIANVIVAILFGLGHLPSASLVMPITPLVVVAALLLNGIAAIPFGMLYRKHGLESAMIAHFSADFVLYVVGTSFL
jgi:membrane protease YdiL (CAAX protease family)